MGSNRNSKLAGIRTTESAGGNGTFTALRSVSDDVRGPYGFDSNGTFVYLGTSQAASPRPKEQAADKKTSNGDDSDFDRDVISVSLVNGSAASVDNPVRGTNGGTFTVDSNGESTFDTGSDFEYLSVGQTATTSVSYTISDGKGETETVTATVTVAGASDTPTSLGMIPQQAGVDGAVQSPLNVSAFFCDANANDTLTFDAAESLPPGLSIDPSTGIIHGIYAPDASLEAPYNVVIRATNSNGVEVVEGFNWTVSDRSASDTVSEQVGIGGNLQSQLHIRSFFAEIRGGNTIDFAPTTSIVAGTYDSDSFQIGPCNTEITVHIAPAEDFGATVIQSFAWAATDAGTDATSNDEYGNFRAGLIVNGTNGGAFAISSDSTYCFDPGSDFDTLAAGETITTSVQYPISDNQGGTEKVAVAVTVTGVDTAPDLSGNIPLQLGVDGTTIAPLHLRAFFGNNGETLTFSDFKTLPPGLSIAPDTGVVTGAYDLTASTRGPYVVTVTATDENGSEVHQTFTWAVKSAVSIRESSSNRTLPRRDAAKRNTTQRNTTQRNTAQLGPSIRFNGQRRLAG